MNTTSLLLLCVIVLVAFVFFRELTSRLRPAFERRAAEKKRDRDREDAMIEAMAKLAVLMTAAAENEATSNSLLGGTMKACSSVAEATVGLRDQVSAFAKLIGSNAPEPTGQYPENNYIPPATEDEAERAGLTFEAMLRNIPVQQAEQEADDHMEKKMMFSALSMGPGE